MISSSLALALSLSVLGALEVSSPIQPPNVQDQDPAATYEKMRADAGEDVDKLWKVYDYCEAYGLEKQGRSVLRKICDVDTENEKAHTLLGHVYYDGQWFTTERKVEEYKREVEVRLAREKGLAPFKDGWVPIEDLPKYERGLVPLDDGRWVTPDVKEKIEKGWQQFDMGWYSPEDFKRIQDEGLFPCGDEWLPLEEADKYHSDMSRWWQIPWDHFSVYSTCSRDATIKALYEMERTYPDMKRLFGTEPPYQPLVILLNGTAQYNAFAGGNPQQGAIVPETSGYSAFKYAFNCEGWVDIAKGEHPGAACGYWDETAENGGWGPYAVRCAAGLAFAQGVDPSPNSARARLANPTSTQFDSAAFWAEKKLPLWLHYGAASYAELYFIEAGAENPFWAREWSVAALAKGGGLDDLSTVFAFPVSADNANSGKLISEAGLIVAFILDAKVPAVLEKHAAFKNALRKGEGLPEAIAALEAVILENEASLREFAGL